MNPEQRTLVVPIDAHGVDRNTLETLVRVAGKLRRTLVGLVLESPRLQKVAALPFATEIILTEGRERRLHRGWLSRQGDQTTRHVLHLLAEIAEHNRVSICFEHAVGERLHTALAHGDQSDIFLPRRRRWHAAAISYAPHRPPPKRLGLVLSTGGDDTAVITVAQALVALDPNSQVYLISSQAPTPEVLQTLSTFGVRVCVQARLDTSPTSLVDFMVHAPYEILILPRDRVAGIAPPILDRALDAAAGQVLIVN